MKAETYLQPIIDDLLALESDPIAPSPSPLPDPAALRQLIDHAKAILFPGYFGSTDIAHHLLAFQTILIQQISNALGHSPNTPASPTPEERAEDFLRQLPNTPASPTPEERAEDFLRQLPNIKRLLATDILAIHKNDPAAQSLTEIILCYPALQAIIHYRIAHLLSMLQIPLLPRILTELAHSATGIDIHPGATIGEYFSIDHGTGVVIGETCIIGNHVHLYQGVTLGAKSFTYDPQGRPINRPRHPIIGDNVIIYSNSTILGPITIGHDSIIGGNVWQAHSIPPYSRIVQHRATTAAFMDGSGI